MAFIISGSVTSSIYLSNVANATMSFYSESVLDKTEYTDANGQYTASFAGTWSGYSQVTASSYLYSTPVTRSYTTASTDQTDQDFSLYRFQSGSGVSGSAFQITNGEEMNVVRQDLGAFYEMANDIDLSAFSNFYPITQRPALRYFSGSFDGKGYTISNFTQTDFTPWGIYFGLFGRLNDNNSNYFVGNFTMNSASVTDSNVSGYGVNVYCGIVVGYCDGDVLNVDVNNSIIYIQPPHHTAIYIGGFTGRNVSGGNIFSCSVSNTTVRLKNTAGGGVNGDWVGGFIGNAGEDVRKCYVSNCIVDNDTGTRAGRPSGFVGTTNSVGPIVDCYVINSVVSGAAIDNISGFCATPFTNFIFRCYSDTIFHGPVSSSWHPFYDESFSAKTVIDCYFDSQSCGKITGSDSATGLPTSQMKSRLSYENWDFDTVWTINKDYNDTHPFLFWEDSGLTASKIEGTLLTSLDVPMADATMSFFASGTSTIDYTTYTDVNGVYTQSVTSDWSGSLLPTSSDNIHEFFSNPNNSGANYFPASVSDKIHDWTGVKDYTSGSGVIDNPYTILDYEDMHNMRYRTGSNTSGEYACYHLGADIDLTSISEWKTINEESPIFYGYFRGNNYTISNMNITVIDDSDLHRHFGLLGKFHHTASHYCGDVTFNSCSINLTDGFTGVSDKYYGIFIAENDSTQITQNVHVRNSTVSHNRTSDTGDLKQYLGGIIGKQVGVLTSCSVEGTTIHYNTTVTTTSTPGTGLLVGQASTTNPITYCYVKSSSLFANRNDLTTYMGLISGGPTAYARDCYALNCSISGSNWVTPIISDFHGSSARLYSAGINYGNTTSSEKYPAYVSGTNSTGNGAIYWESGINTFVHSTGSDSGVYSGSTNDINSIRYMREYRGTVGLNFDNTWGRNFQYQNGYPYLSWENPTVTSFQVEGITSSSLGVAFQNVTESFHASGTTTITYTTTSSVLGEYSQSIDYGWSGSFAATASAGHQFFSEQNSSGSIPVNIELRKSDMIIDRLLVKDFSSGSGQSVNPYIVLDHEDFNNLRFRTFGWYYKLGSDIDLSYFSNWIPIPGYYSTPNIFQSSLDGDNYTISNMSITGVGFPTSSVSLYFGLFGALRPGGGRMKNLTLHSCSVNVPAIPSNLVGTFGNGLTGGIFAGNYYVSFTTEGKLRNVHLDDCSLIISAGSTPSINHYVGGLVGSCDALASGESAGNALASCSVTDTVIKYDVLHAGQTYVGGLFGRQTYYFQFNEGAFATHITHINNYVKNSSFYININNTTSSAAKFGVLGGSPVVRFDDCYSIGCLISGSARMAPISNGFKEDRTRRTYAAQVDYGNTLIENRYVFTAEQDTTFGFCYWESGSLELIHTSSAEIGAGVTGSTTGDMKNKTSYNTWDFNNVWAINSLYNDGYPFFYHENPDVTSKIEGTLVTSLNSEMEDVTMSFYASGTSTINYTTYTDVNGVYTQSVAHGWSGSLLPTSSGDTHEFFSGLNDSESVYFPATVSDKTHNTVGVKNYSSGSGNDTNPYIVLDHEDMHNVRYRTGSSAVFTHPHYKLGSDIDLSPIGEWTPIPQVSQSIFYGGFDGDNYTISNMSITEFTTTNQDSKFFGLFARHQPRASGSRNINFHSCSINLSGSVPNVWDANAMAFGILAGEYYRNWSLGPDVRLRNIHVNNCVVKVLKENPVRISQYLGGIAGTTNAFQGAAQYYGHGMTSCSVQNTTITLDLLGGHATVTYIGGLSGESYLGVGEPVDFSGISYCFVKNCTLFYNNSDTYQSYISGISGHFHPYIYDTYVLNCIMSGSKEVAPLGSSVHASSTRVYVAGIDYGNTNIDDKYQFLSGLTETTTPSNFGFCYWESGSEVFTNTSSLAGVTGSTPAEMILSESFKTFDFENVWLRSDSKNSAYPYLSYETFLIAIAGLTLHYDSRIGYISASNIWTDLSGNGVDATTSNTFPSGGHLYFGTEFGPSSASFSSLIVSNSFAIEMFIAPTTQSSKMYLFSTTSGSFPKIDGYMSESNVYFGFQSSSTDTATYISSSSPLNVNKFNHIGFQVAPDSGTLWVNGTFEPSASFAIGSTGWSGGTIGVLDTIQTNPYYGYVDVFKVWNSPEFNPTVKTTVDTYHVSRSYFTGLPEITYPSP